MGLGCLLIYEIVQSEDLVKKIIVQASQNATNNANHNNRDNIHPTVCHSYSADIKHDKPSFSKKATFPGAAYFNKSPEHHHHNGCAEKSSPQKGTPPPCCHLFKSKQYTTHRGSESCTDPRGGPTGNEIPAVTVVIHVAKPAPFNTVIVRPPLA